MSDARAAGRPCGARPEHRDRSLGGHLNNGRIYVGWSDLSTSGGHRCTDLSDAPDATQDTFKSYVASAPDYATLTADPTTLSHERGTNVIGDAGDHWFPWVAIDQSTGQAYVDLYSTRDDSTRKSAKFYARAVVPGAGSTRVSYGPLTAVSSDATNYSDQDCCGFGNDYGDYTGLDAEGGNVYAVWTHRLLNQDGDVFVNVLAASAVPATPTEVPARRCDRRRAAATSAATAADHHRHDADGDAAAADDRHHADAAAAGTARRRGCRSPTPRAWIAGALHGQARQRGRGRRRRGVGPAARDRRQAQARHRAARDERYESR